MNNGIYSALAGLVSRSQQFEIVSNNLANASSPGYRGQRSFFQTLQEGASEGRDSSQAISGQFSVLGGSYVDGRAGQLESTGNPLDLALEGSGYFAIQTKQGLRYTRNGQFHLSADNHLLDAAGDQVLGDQGPIELPPGPVSISSEGMISRNGAIAGQIRVVEFPAGSQLRPEGNSYFISERPESATPATGTLLRQGFIEASNITPVEGAVEMVLLQRQTEMLEKALSIFHTEFNRIAAEELPKAL